MTNPLTPQGEREVAWRKFRKKRGHGYLMDEESFNAGFNAGKAARGSAQGNAPGAKYWETRATTAEAKVLEYHQKFVELASPSPSEGATK